MMNKITLVLVGILVIVAGVFGYFYFTKQQQKEGVVRAASSATVQVTPNGFIPETVVIKAGQRVEWLNTDTKPHQISPDPHPSHSSFPELAVTDALQTKESMSFSFTKKGKYTYHDETNPLEFRGVIIVE